MNAQSDEENFINENTSNHLVIAEDSENILEHALSAIRTSYKSKTPEETVIDDYDTTDNSLKSKLRGFVNSLVESFSKPNIYILYFLVTIKVLAENMVLSIILDQTLKKITNARDENKARSLDRKLKFIRSIRCSSHTRQ